MSSQYYEIFNDKVQVKNNCLNESGYMIDLIGLIQYNEKMMIRITDNIFIDEKDIAFKTSRSSGPGGQNVNKVNTRVTLLLDVKANENLTERQKRLVLSAYTSRIDKNGVLRVISQKYRTQKENREAAIERLQKLLAEILKYRPIRKKTKKPKSADRRRLEQKRQRSLLKKQRSKTGLTGDTEY